MATTTTRPKASTRRQPKAAPVRIKLADLGGVRPTSCGQLFELKADANVAAEGCKRLPRHHGVHKADRKPRGLMTPAERRRIDGKRVTKAASKVATRIVTIARTKFRVPLDKAGQPLLAKATAVVGPVAK